MGEREGEEGEIGRGEGVVTGCRGVLFERVSGDSLGTPRGQNICKLYKVCKLCNRCPGGGLCECRVLRGCC